MAFIFTMRSTPVNGNTMHRRDNTATSNGSLPAISEDSAAFILRRDTPPIPPRAIDRPANAKLFGLRAPVILANDELGPPAYSQFDGPNGEKLANARIGISNNKHIARRGGWKRLTIIALIIALCLIALIVGLVVGLRKENGSSK